VSSQSISGRIENILIFDDRGVVDARSSVPRLWNSFRRRLYHIEAERCGCIEIGASIKKARFAGSRVTSRGSHGVVNVTNVFAQAASLRISGWVA